MEEAGKVKIVRIVYDASKAREGANQARKSLEDIEKSVGNTNGTLARMEAQLGKLGAGFNTVSRFASVFGIALSVGAVTSFARELTEAVGGLGSMAEQLTTNTRQLQGMQYAATGASVKLSDLEVGAAAYSRKIGQASEGNKEAIEIFNRLGIKILDAQGAVRPYGDLLTDAARSLDKVDNANTRVALSTEVFDKAGRKMLVLLPALARGQDDLAASAERAGAMIKPETIDKWDKLGSTAEQSMLKWRAFAAENFYEPVAFGFRAIAGAIEVALAPLKLFIYGMEQAGKAASWLGSKFTTGPDSGTGAQESLERIEFERNNLAGQPGAAPLLKKLDLDRARVQGRGGQGWNGPEPNPSYSSPTVGASNPPPKGTGQNEAERYAKLITQLGAAAEAQDRMTAAARRGDVAFQEQTVAAAAAQKAIEIYGKALEATDPRLQKIVELMQRAAQGKAAESFAVATTELEKQNVLLEAELRLLNEFPEVRARELALIKAKHEAEKAGTALTVEDIERRRQAIEQNERLKGQAEEMKRANEMWLEPLKSGLQSIQQTAADMWDRILENGRFSMEEFGQLFIRTARRAAAELLALATIRPVIGMGVQALGSLGLVSPQTASALGYGSMGGLGGGAGGGLGMPSLGGGSLFGNLSGSLGSFGQWLNTPFTGPYAGMSPASMQGVPMLSPSMWNPSSWGITPLQGIGAVAGIGSGIFQLATGNGSTASTIGGIGSMIGGAVSLIPGIGQIAGPLISLASAFLPGLFGGEQQKYVDNQAYGALNYGAGGWSTSGGAWGPSADARSLQQPLGQLGNSLDSIFGMLGGVKDPGKVWGMASETSSRTGGGWNLNQSWSYLIDPSTGAKSLWRAGEDNMLDSGGAQVAVRSILGGAVGEISQSMRTALYTVGQRGSSGSLAQVGQAVDFVSNVYDRLGKSTASVADAIRKLNAEFEATASTAASLGLSLAPVRQEQEKRVKRVAQDFLDGMLDPRAVALRELEDQRKDSLASAEYIRDNVKDVYVDMARIAEYWTKKKLEIEQQYYEQSTGRLEEAIRRLTPGGDLANLDPRGTLAGLEAGYAATRAQAFAGDQAAIGRLAEEGLERAEFSRSYYAGSARYNADRDAILQDLLALQANMVPGGAGGQALDQNAGGPQAQQVSRLLAAVETLTEELREERANSARLNNLLSRYITNTTRVG
jgi:hypothetical protein